MNDNRNLMMAILLSALVLFGWSFLSDRFMPAAPRPAQVTVAGTPAPLPQASPVTPAQPAVRSRAAVLAASPRVTIATPSLQGSINLKGARFDDLMLVRQREALSANSPPVRLLSPGGAPHAYFASFGWSGEGVATPDANALWTASAPSLTPGHPVTLSWSNPTGQKFELIVAVDEGYLFTIDQRVTNLAPTAVAVRPYGLVSRATQSADPSTWTNHVGPISFLAGKADYGVNWKTLDEDKAGVTRDSRGGWLGFTDKYWLTALVPASDAQVAASFRKGDSGAYQADYAAAPIIVAPGQAVSGESRFFAGAKEKPWLDTYESAGITKLSKSIDWGWFEWFMRPIFDLLQWLFHATGNFGVAIICLTFIVRALMFPIADKQFKSMAGMRRVQPKMKAIQERHKEDKPRLQQEMLKLYQEEKINPAAGCLPILLQIPVFYALYKVLMVSVEMRHQPFILWIKDLSSPDPMHVLNLFGLLHFTPPSFLAIGPLAILLGITMWLQFKLNPTQMDPVQQQVFSFMPWVMMFVMAPFAAGLLLYWVTSNILTIAQQKWLYKRYDMQAGTVILEATPIKK
ncbi:MAG: membrane protein insertase YidC [Sphingomicrobium sp.]